MKDERPGITIGELLVRDRIKHAIISFASVIAFNLEKIANPPHGIISNEGFLAITAVGSILYGTASVLGMTMSQNSHINKG